MLPKRLRRRLRQLDDGPAEPPQEAPEREEAAADDGAGSGGDAERSAAVRAGEPGASRERLAEQAHRLRESRPPPEASRSREIEPPSGPLEDLVPGESIEGEHGSYWLVQGAAAELLPHGPDVLADLERVVASIDAAEKGYLAHLRGVPPRHLALLDTETGGLSSAPVFLVGMILWESDAAGEALSVQMLARDYAEERAVLAEGARLLAGRRVLMTYNGRSFDIPMMRERMIYHALGACPEPPAHVDLLHAIRARFRGRWEDCRLQTVERHLCGRSRWADIDGAEIPEAWHQFVHTGDAGRMAQVLEHNRLDLITMLEVLPYLMDPDCE
ncbi:MAG: ribonuclease H-like domain-containing protein [Armatimonadota bacterium]|nr:ribonuclease H-like domain-containing protein [Armatimonadota bacterium]